jgi:hypothetical protein
MDDDLEEGYVGDYYEVPDSVIQDEKNKEQKKTQVDDVLQFNVS